MMEDKYICGYLKENEGNLVRFWKRKQRYRLCDFFSVSEVTEKKEYLIIS